MTRMISTLAYPRHVSAGACRLPRRRAIIGVLLVGCLLLAQWLGYAHAIAHGHGQGNPAIQLQKAERIADASVFDHPKASGSCAALDAAALGAGLCGSGLALPAAHAPELPPVAIVEQRWLPAYSPPFASRAPPLKT